MIKYEIPYATTVKLEIFTIDGRYVETLVDTHQEAGQYRVTWSGDGRSAGVYLARLGTSAYTGSIKLMLLK